MKLIYLSNARIPTEKAHGSQIMKMCENFARQGCEVELILPHRANEIKGSPFDFYGTAKIFRITFLPCLDQESLKFLPEKLSFVIQTLTFYLSARIYLLLNSYDYFYSREQAVSLWFKHAIVELHSLPRKIRGADIFAWKRADKFVVLTSFIKQGLVDKGIAENKIIVAGDAADLEDFKGIIDSKEKIRAAYGLPSDKKIFSYIGKFKTMGMDKGVGLFINAFARVSKNRNDCFLLLVGLNEDEIGEIKGLCSSLGLAEDKYCLLLHVPQQVAFRYMKSSDVLVMAYPNITHYAYYMSPLKLFEYMASGTAILSTDLPSIREILDESNSILVGPDSEDEFARGISLALADPENLDKLADQAYRDVAGHTWAERAQRILNFIKQ